MARLRWHPGHPKTWLLIPVLLSLMAALACGTATTPTPAPKATPVAQRTTPAVTPIATVAPTPAAQARARVDRLIYATAIIPPETNRVWQATLAFRIQHDPFLETLIDIDVTTGAFVPRLADRWEMTPDGKNWTFFLRKGVPFHFGFGEFTAKDVVHTHSLATAPDALSAFSSLWKEADKLEVVNDHEVVFRMKNPLINMPFIASRAGDMMPISKGQWDKEGVAGIDKKPAGTGSYQYLGRRLGGSVSFERVENHWRGEKPEFKELEIRWVREEATRLAVLLSGEAHMADVSRELQNEAVRKGVGKVITSNLTAAQLVVYFGGQYHITGDPKFKPDVPWNDIRVRQAMNMAINRKEMRDLILKGGPAFVYLTGWFPFSEGWNPEWEKRFDELYGYNPTKAKDLLKQAGYPPGTLKGKTYVYARAEVPELPTILEAMSVYFKAVGIQMELEELEFARVLAKFRAKDIHCCLFATLPSYRPIETHLSVHQTSGGTPHSYEDDFIERNYLALKNTIDPKERDRLAREIGNHIFEQIPAIPLFAFFVEVVANPKVVDSWTFPGITAAGVSHWNLIKAAK